jgi:hypothetical protein
MLGICSRKFFVPKKQKKTCDLTRGFVQAGQTEKQSAVNQFSALVRA